MCNSNPFRISFMSDNLDIPGHSIPLESNTPWKCVMEPNDADCGYCLYVWRSDRQGFKKHHENAILKTSDFTHETEHYAYTLLTPIFNMK